jgi:cytochrome o ubiquinol oxidase subunit 1
MKPSDLVGRLTLQAFQHDLIEMGAGLSMFLGALAVTAYLTYTRRWTSLWKDWITTVDPKKIGIMYMIVSILMLFKGLVDAGMMRAQQVLSVGDSHGYLSSPHFQQLFTAHGVTMIFFVAMGVLFGFMNLLLPLQIGARDVAFPFLNSLSFWLFAISAVFVNLSLVIGNFSGAGWLAYPPLSTLEYNPGVGVDYWIWTLQISGAGTLLSGINFLVTILKMRCPGMTLMRMPLFVWASLASVVLIVFAFPILTATLWMLSLDRLLGMHFFTSSFGGNPMMFINLIWAWGHPEVYILVLPAFGIFSEVVATFSSKRIFGYVSMVWAIVAITVLSFLVWLHHFFTMGAGPGVNAFFGIMTMLIAIPTGAKVFNWLFTKLKGRVRYTTPMLWFMGFILAFTIGGATGVLMAIPPADFQVHNSLFLIAHFHSMVLPGVLFGVFAAITYWFPKVMGFRLNERWGRYAFWCWLIGFCLAFLPLFLLGFMGATRRLDHYEAATGWQPFFLVAALGFLVICLGVLCQIIQVIQSYRYRKENRDKTGDPWDGRTLEWATFSPPPVYNFAHIPHVNDRDAFTAIKEGRAAAPQGPYQPIHMPKNTSLGFFVGLFSFFFGFGLIWYIAWMTWLGLLGIIVSLILRAFDNDTDFFISAEEVAHIEANKQGYAWQDL